MGKYFSVNYCFGTQAQVVPEVFNLHAQSVQSVPATGGTAPVQTLPGHIVPADAQPPGGLQASDPPQPAGTGGGVTAVPSSAHNFPLGVRISPQIISVRPRLNSPLIQMSFIALLLVCRQLGFLDMSIR